MTPLFLASAVSDWIPGSVHGAVPAGLLVVVDGAVRALVVACVVGAALRVLAPRQVPAQKMAWGLVLVGALLMPVLAPWAGKADWVPSTATWIVPAQTWWQAIGSRAASLLAWNAGESRPGSMATISDGGAGSTAFAERRDGAALVFAQADRFPAPSISSDQMGGGDLAARNPVRTRFEVPLPDVAWLIYGAVCLALLLRLAYGLGGAIGLWQSAEPVEVHSHLADGLHVRASKKISSPVTVGSGVVLPADYEEWDSAKLRIVLAHERSHVRQGDFYLQLLAGLYAAMFWFSPLGWWLKGKLSDLSETISDHAGLEEADSHASYARILLEFAALPRRSEVGVAMAHSGRISQRIERLLNEHSFRQAFTGGRTRVWAAVLLVPTVLFAAAALIRVQAAQTLQQAAAMPGPVIEQPQAADGEDAEALATEAVDSSASAQAAPEAAPAPSQNENQNQDETVTTNAQCNGNTDTTESARSSSRSSSRRGYSYSYSDDGDSYALVSGKNQEGHFSGDWHNGDIDKARAMAHGDFLWFSHEGKSYVVDDPQTIAQIQAMYKPMEELGKKQEELGHQQEALGRQQAELGERQEQASIPTPDISQEMAKLNEAIAKLQAKKDGTITMDQLAEVQGKIGDLQGKLGGLQGRIGAEQGELGRAQGELGRQQGELGEQQGRLGAEQGRLAREADMKVKSVIDGSLKSGRAREVR